MVVHDGLYRVREADTSSLPACSTANRVAPNYLISSLMRSISAPRFERGLVVDFTLPLMLQA